jgi:TP901 family phage tail tape measure protein
MSRADVEAGKAYVSLTVKDDALTRGLQKARQELNDFGSRMIALGASIVAATTAMAAPVAFASKTFADFDDAMRAVGAVTQATAADLAMLTHTAEKLGETTSFTAMEVAALMQELGRAGFDPAQIDKMTASVMNLARATGTDATLASEILSSSIRQFGLNAEDAGRVADVLTMAANKTSSSVDGLGESLSYAGPVARELGMSLEETVAILGTLGNVGIRGSEAGTALRRLGVISAATGEDLKKIFNISNTDAAGNLKPLVRILSEIGVVVGNMPVAERVAKMNEAFGLLGITSASAMARASTDTQQLAIELQNASGAAAEAAVVMDAGLGGSMRRIMSAIEGLEIALGQALADSLAGITEGIIKLVASATEWIKHSPELITTFATIATSAAVAGVALILLGIRAKLTAGIVAAAGLAYQAAAITAAAAWTALVVVFNVLTIKSRITSAIIRTAWVGSVTAISMAFKGLSAVISAAFVTSVMVASATVIGAVWLTAIGAISVAVFGLGTVLSTTAAIATTAWTAAAGVVSTVWGMSAGAIGLSWGTLSGALITLAAAATGAWTAGAGIMGTSLAVVQALLGVLGIEGSVAAALVSAALSAAATISSLAWTGFGMVLSAVFTWANLVAVAGFAVSAAWTAAWVAFSGPILPIIAGLTTVVAVVGSIAAAAMYAAAKGLDFSEAWKVVTSTLSEMLAIAKTVGGILMDAFAGGDYDIAFRAAMAGMKLALASAIDAMTNLWSQFWSGAWKMTKAFFANFASIAWKIVKAIANAIANPLKAASAIKTALTDLVSGKSEIKLGFDTTGMRDSARKEIENLEKELESRKQKRDAEQAKKEEEEKQKEWDAAAAKKKEAEAAGGDGVPVGDATASEIDAEAAAEAIKTASAFNRETEALQQQIIALRQGEEAAERFRLAKEGLSEEQIAQVMALRAEQDALEKTQEASQRMVRRIQEIADADYEKNKLSPAEIAKKEKAEIEARRKGGQIDAKTAAEAMAEADIRQAEKEHQERLKKFRGDGTDGKLGGASFGLKDGGASAATFSAQSLLSMGSGAGQGPQMRAMIETKKAIMEQTKQAMEQSEKQIAAIKQTKLKH